MCTVKCWGHLHGLWNVTLFLFLVPLLFPLNDDSQPLAVFSLGYVMIVCKLIVSRCCFRLALLVLLGDSLVSLLCLVCRWCPLDVKSLALRKRPFVEQLYFLKQISLAKDLFCFVSVLNMKASQNTGTRSR